MRRGDLGLAHPPPKPLWPPGLLKLPLCSIQDSPRPQAAVWGGQGRPAWAAAEGRVGLEAWRCPPPCAQPSCATLHPLCHSVAPELGRRFWPGLASPSGRPRPFGSLGALWIWRLTGFPTPHASECHLALGTRPGNRGEGSPRGCGCSPELAMLSGRSLRKGRTLASRPGPSRPARDASPLQPTP